MLNASALPVIGFACCNHRMHTGERLGAALREAMELKKVRQHHVATEFGIKQPSVSEWLRFGRIGKQHIPHLVAYFSDVVGPEHWGLPSGWSDTPSEIDQDLLRDSRVVELLADISKLRGAKRDNAILEAVAAVTRVRFDVPAVARVTGGTSEIEPSQPRPRTPEKATTESPRPAGRRTVKQ